MGLSNPTHILMVAAIALLVFGARRLPEVGRSLGEGMRGFRDSLQGETAPAPALPAPVQEEPAPPA